VRSTTSTSPTPTPTRSCEVRPTPCWRVGIWTTASLAQPRSFWKPTSAPVSCSIPSSRPTTARHRRDARCVTRRTRASTRPSTHWPTCFDRTNRPRLPSCAASFMPSPTGPTRTSPATAAFTNPPRSCRPCSASVPRASTSARRWRARRPGSTRRCQTSAACSRKPTGRSGRRTGNGSWPPGARCGQGGRNCSTRPTATTTPPCCWG